MSRHPTMADIARVAGVSQSTVSRALKDDPRISAPERARVNGISRTLGYRPNPLVSALMAARRSGQRRSGAETVAFISSYATPRGWAGKPTCRGVFQGLEERAEELGYRIEVFSVRDYRKKGSLEKTLHARGIRGAVMGFTDSALEPFTMVTDNLAVAGIGNYFPYVIMDRSQVHGFSNVRLGLAKLRELGYRKIGLAVPCYNNALSGNTWSAAYLDDQWQLPPFRRCELFMPESGVADRSEFGAWLTRNRPDAVLIYKLNLLPVLSGLGLRVPQDMGAAFLHRSPEERSRSAGVDGNFPQLGRSAMDLVIGRLHTNSFGSPGFPREVLTCGSWWNGPTVLGRL